MILNISGRTDIVAFYTNWLMNRFNEGYVDVRNPFYPRSVSRIFFNDVEAIVFCTKNPKPILPYLDKINIPSIFQVTCTPYTSDIELAVGDKKEIIDSMIELSRRLGKENVVLRYDPILINDKYTVDYHERAFERLCSLLEGYVGQVIVSFVDEYKNVNRHMGKLKIKQLSEEDYIDIGKRLVKITNKYGMSIQTCYEKNDLSSVGFIQSACCTKELAYRLTGRSNFPKWKARDCGCVEMVDIGAYNTCGHYCRYCYANYDEKNVTLNRKNHDEKSSLLIGYLDENDVIKVRKK
ncbi:DUF1848 domain-containing protein [Anaerorhabdus sp.]|uniref:DUF1848 domain-containing protein n=1 Tax=Anaerorhabdus sp. TaxID=1872524 RepID=UPI002FC71184